VIYYGIENSEVPRRSLDRGTDKFRFAFVGRFVPEKGIEVLLLAAEILRSLKLEFEVRLIGDGPLRSELESVIKRLDLAAHVRITGFVAPGLPMKDELRDVDAVVVPSVWEEAAGFSAIEQMIDGRLVIASDIGGLAEVVADGGLLFPPGDAAALASIMKRVVLDQSLVESIGLKGRKRALAVFNRDRMIRDHACAYREAVSNRRQR
jgi:glycosyltransferase involved in cell wall biosynthesis